MRNIIVAAGVALLTATGAAAQGVPGLMNFQGTLQDAEGSFLDGTYTLEFRIWDHPTETDEETHLLWGRSYTAQVVDGFFNVILGAPGGAVAGAEFEDIEDAFQQGVNTFVGFRVLTDHENQLLSQPPPEIQPRQQVLSAPYALTARHAEQARTADDGAPVGSVTAFAGREDAIPQGWLLCDGRELPVEDYPRLYDVLDDLYGATGSTDTFRIPDYRGYFLRAADLGAGRDPNAEDRFQHGTSAPSAGEVGSWQDDEFKSHTHRYDRSVAPSGFSSESGTGWDEYIPGDSNWETDETGGDETRPKNVYVHYIIKY